MDLATLLGLLIAGIGILFGYTIEGGSIASLVNAPGFMIVVVGTLGATMISYPLRQFLAMPGSFIRALRGSQSLQSSEMVDQLVAMADKARREGLLSLEEEAQSVDNEFARKALLLMIDGTDPEALKAIMEIEMDSASTREAERADIYKVASGFAPTLGVLGAVMGLISVLGGLGGDVSELGHGIATAFVATFYGVGFANVVLLPISTKLRGMSNDAQVVREMILEGILSIQAGDNPRIVREKLQGFLPPSERSSGEQDPTAERMAA